MSGPGPFLIDNLSVLAENVVYDGAPSAVQRVLQFNDVSTLLADTSLTYTGGSPVSVEAGDHLNAGVYRYQVAATGATNHHLTTAGGVKLYVVPAATGVYPLTAFGVAGSNTAAVNSARLQAAFDVLDTHLPGTTVALPGEVIDFDTGLHSKTIAIQGVGWHTPRPPKGTASYENKALLTGSILRFVGASGVALRLGAAAVIDATFKSLWARDVAVIGVAGNTATGVVFCDQLSGMVSNIRAGNFERGFDLQWSEDATYMNLSAVGCTIGLFSDTDGTNQNVFYNFEFNNCGTSVDFSDCRLNVFYGGLAQGDGLTRGIRLRNRCDSNQFLGWWFEGTWSSPVFSTEGVDNFGNVLSKCRVSQDTNSIDLSGTLAGSTALGSHVIEDIFVLGGGAITLTIGAELSPCWLKNVDSTITVTDNSNRSVIFSQDGKLKPWLLQGDYNRGESRVQRSRALIQFAGLDTSVQQSLENITDTTGALVAYRTISSGRMIIKGSADTDMLSINLTTGVLAIAGRVQSQGLEPNLPTWADNAAAVAGGLAVGRLYRTATGEVRVVV